MTIFHGTSLGWLPSNRSRIEDVGAHPQAITTRLEPSSVVTMMTTMVMAMAMVAAWMQMMIVIVLFVLAH